MRLDSSAVDLFSVQATKYAATLVREVIVQGPYDA